RDALGYLNALAGEAQDDLTLQRDLARAYQEVGDVQGGSTVASLGDTTGAIDSYDRARQILEGLLRADPADLPTRRALADVYAALGTLVLETGDVRASLAHARQARAHLDAAAAGRPIDLELRLALSR